jgi:hypothetical protein
MVNGKVVDIVDELDDKVNELEKKCYWMEKNVWCKNWPRSKWKDWKMCPLITQDCWSWLFKANKKKLEEHDLEARVVSKKLLVEAEIVKAIEQLKKMRLGSGLSLYPIPILFNLSCLRKLNNKPEFLSNFLHLVCL